MVRDSGGSKDSGCRVRFIDNNIFRAAEESDTESEDFNKSIMMPKDVLSNFALAQALVNSSEVEKLDSEADASRIINR